ncbi:MAG: acyl--CoA ligase [Hyphomicrobiales bacterium]|nr:acyl--CoA ligase [Hyphomicrobiales bacterium]
MAENDFDYLLECPLDPIEFIERRAKITPLAFAMRHPRGNYTYQALLAGIDQIAMEFHKAGLRQGETAAIQLDNYFLALMSALALSRIGCTCIFQLIERQMDEVNVKALITKGGSDLQGIPHIEFQDSWLTIGQNAAPVMEFKKGFLSTDSLAVYTLSSGSTGRPKIISSTWRRLHQTVIDSLLHKHHKPSLGPCMVSLGFTSLWGYRQMLTILWTGGTLVFGNIHVSTASHFRALGIRHLAASIAQLTLWAKIARDNPHFFSSVEVVTTGGARLAPKLAELVRRDICGEIYINYGSTETGLIAAGDVDILKTHPDAVGVVLGTATVEIVDENGKVLPFGQTGSVRVRTGAMSGDAITKSDGQQWFLTGDSGALSKNGILSIFGRNDGVMNLEGVKIRFEDGEQLLSECPGVADVALFAVQNRIGLSELFCAYVPEKDFDDDLFTKGLRKLPKISATLELTVIPRGGNGKVLRHELASIYLDMKKKHNL